MAANFQSAVSLLAKTAAMVYRRNDLLRLTVADRRFALVYTIKVLSAEMTNNIASQASRLV